MSERMFRDVDVLRLCQYICILKRALPVPDIIPIDIQILYYSKVKIICRYYYMFNSFSFAMYNLEYILLSSYVVWRNDQLIHKMLFDGFKILESFDTPAGISADKGFFQYYE